MIESVRTPEPRVQGQRIYPNCDFCVRTSKQGKSATSARSFQIRSPTSLILVPTSSALVPNSPPTSLTLVSTSFALDPDSQLTVAINRGQTTTVTVLSEHHNKDQRKRTLRRSATMFAVFLLCVLRATFVHARTRRWAVRTSYDSVRL